MPMLIHDTPLGFIVLSCILVNGRAAITQLDFSKQTVHTPVQQTAYTPVDTQISCKQNSAQPAISSCSRPWESLGNASSREEYFQPFQGENTAKLPQFLLPEAGRSEPFSDEEISLLHEAASQITAYFAGQLTEFSLPLAPSGTPFQREVWNELLRIPYGETRSYGQIAAKIGRPRAARAVGRSCHCNPIGIIIPCHRVIGAGGQLTGYAGGLERKRRLLSFEKITKITAAFAK